MLADYTAFIENENNPLELRALARLHRAGRMRDLSLQVADYSAVVLDPRIAPRLRHEAWLRRASAFAAASDRDSGRRDRW
ncbi:MAG: hypothetical protein HY719_08395 [Planctomycetes bacterium]|nr:hypothetical protein [Planctomycetota bacterium]